MGIEDWGDGRNWEKEGQIMPPQSLRIPAQRWGSQYETGHFRITPFYTAEEPCV